MTTRDPRVDAYIASREPFARPILHYLRDVVHEGCPDVQETIKWGVPSLEYKGPFAGIAAFKAHCAFGFWKQSLLANDGLPAADIKAAGSFGRITRLEDLPSRQTLLKLVKAARKLNDDDVKAPRMKTAPKKPVKTPVYLAAALKKNKKAQANYKAFSPTKKRDYVEWLEAAKVDATRAKRLRTALEWMAQGKSRNWKYERKK